MIRFKGLRPVFYPECCLSFPAVSRVKEELSLFGPDVIHVVTEFGIGYAGMRAARELSIPLVMSYHTNLDQYLKYFRFPHLKKTAEAYLRWFHSFPLVNLCPSRDTIRQLHAQGYERLGLWTRGIDTVQYSPARRSEELRKKLGGENRLIFLYAGRMSAEKGLHILTESIRLVNETVPDRILFVFTGDGPLLPELKALDLPKPCSPAFRPGKRWRRSTQAATHLSSRPARKPSGTWRWRRWQADFPSSAATGEELPTFPGT